MSSSGKLEIDKNEVSYFNLEACICHFKRHRYEMRQTCCMNMCRVLKRITGNRKRNKTIVAKVICKVKNQRML